MHLILIKIDSSDTIFPKSHCNNWPNRFTFTPLELPSELLFHVKCTYFHFVFHSSPSSITIVSLFHVPHISTLSSIFPTSIDFNSSPFPHHTLNFPPFHNYVYYSPLYKQTTGTLPLMKGLMLTSEYQTFRKGY